MKTSRALIPTLKEGPADAGAGAALLVRAGYVRRSGGAYDVLPLGARVLRRLEARGRAAMEELGGLEVALARAGLDGAMGLARRELRSWRDLPRTLFQCEARHLDAFAFAADDAARAAYDSMRAVCMRMCEGARFVDAPGGVACEELVARGGEDAILECDACGYAARAEVAIAGVKSEAEEARPMRKAHTPNARSIEEVTAFLGVPKAKMLKSLLYVADGAAAMAVVRGDDAVSEPLLARALGARSLSLASAEDVAKATGAAVGFAGPAGFRGRIVADRAAAYVVNAVAGANETDHHVVDVCRGRDWDGAIADLRAARPGDACRCGGTLASRTGLAVARVTLHGTRESEAREAMFADEAQARRPLAVATCAIDLARVMEAIAASCSDANGLRWPAEIAPYDVHLCTIGADAAVIDAAAALYDALLRAGIAVLWDDRDARAGVKLKDADLIGLPLRLTVGARGVSAGTLEAKARADANVATIPLVEAVAWVRSHRA